MKILQSDLFVEFGQCLMMSCWLIASKGVRKCDNDGPRGLLEAMMGHWLRADNWGGGVVVRK